MKTKILRRLLGTVAAATMIATSAVSPAGAFCGFYVAKADTKLFNEASKVVLVRDGDRTVITMASDFQGDVKEFAMVVPVPVVLKKEQVHVTEMGIIDHLDAYTAPRLVEYFDEDPCRVYAMKDAMPMPTSAPEAASARSDDALGVKIEAQYTVGEYDIIILSANQSDGLSTWLTQNGYKIPAGAGKVLDSYIKQGTKFFVAKVNLKEFAKLGGTYLRPLQMAFETPKFMLPIRLGTVNAKADQEMFVFALTREGRVETTNYRTVKIPSDTPVPLFVKDEFSEFYRAMFTTATKKENGAAVFLEYAWDMSWCDPCAADPLSVKQLEELGVMWFDDNQRKDSGPARDVYVTRLHVRYNGEKFPEDLKFQATGNKENFQGRYVMTHPWKGKAECEQAEDYLKSLPDRFESEAQTLARLTGWDIADIRQKMKASGQTAGINTDRPDDDRPWWDRIWRRGEDR